MNYSPLKHTIHLRRRHYKLDAVQLRNLVEEFRGTILEGALPDGPHDEEDDEITVELAGSLMDKIDLENALWGFRVE